MDQEQQNRIKGERALVALLYNVIGLAIIVVGFVGASRHGWLQWDVQPQQTAIAFGIFLLLTYLFRQFMSNDQDKQVPEDKKFNPNGVLFQHAFHAVTVALYLGVYSWCHAPWMYAAVVLLVSAFEADRSRATSALQRLGTAAETVSPKETARAFVGNLIEDSGWAAFIYLTHLSSIAPVVVAGLLVAFIRTVVEQLQYLRREAKAH